MMAHPAHRSLMPALIKPPKSLVYLKKSSGLILALALGGCAQYATVSVRKPQFQPATSTAPWFGEVNSEIAKGIRQENHEPLPALGSLLHAAEISARQLAINPADAAARDAYNFSVARVIALIPKTRLDPWTQPVRVPAAGGEFVLSRKPDARKGWNPALYDFL